MAGVSIVVPVYNAGERLKRCVESILNQTFRELEIILIDDGSRDGSGGLCDAFAQADGRVRSIHRANGGPSAARNCGLAEATGEYTGFVDADDWIEPEMVGRLYRCAKGADADIAVCDYFAETGGAPRPMRVLRENRPFYDAQEIRQQIFPYFFGYEDREVHGCKACCPFADYRSYVWLGLYRTQLIRRHHITFPSEKTYYNEDNLFNLLFMEKAQRLGYVRESLYHYTDAPDSFTSRYNARFFEMKRNKYAYLGNLIRERGLGPEFEKRLRNKIGAESISVINYYAAASGPREKADIVRTILRDPLIAGSIGQMNLSALPLSPQKLFLLFARLGAATPLLWMSRAYLAATRLRNGSKRS